MTSKSNPSPSEPEGNKNIVDTESETVNESVAMPMDPLAQLQADVEAARAEVAEWQDRFLRKAAEFENYRKRSEKEKADSVMLAKGSVLNEFLPIADSCERALKIFREEEGAAAGLQHYQEGVELLYRQVLDTLNRAGVVAVEAEGKQFDPHLHEALSRQETSDFKEGTIIKELQRGYLFKDKLLRPSQVVVAAHPQGKDQANE